MSDSSRFRPVITCVRRLSAAGGLALFATLAPGQDGTPGARPGDSPGEIARPSTEQIMNSPLLRNALSRSTDGLVYNRAPGGAVSVDLQGRFQNVSVARIGADGEIEMACSGNHDSLAAFLAAHPGASERDYRANAAQDSTGVGRDE